MLVEQLNDDLKVAMKARDAAKVQVLRHIIAQCKNLRIEKGEDLTDDDVVAVLKKGVKSRTESVELYRQGGRTDLAGIESAEIVVLEAYLPEQLSGDALTEAVRAIIAEVGASSMKEMGAVMKAVMEKHGASVDGKSVQAVVKEQLSG